VEAIGWRCSLAALTRSALSLDSCTALSTRVRGGSSDSPSGSVEVYEAIGEAHWEGVVVQVGEGCHYQALLLVRHYL